MQGNNAFASGAAPDRRNLAQRSALMRIVTTEFRELRGAPLSQEQTGRLFGLPGEVCRRILTALVADGSIEGTSDGRYIYRNFSGGKS